jgi:hypothetical protein
VLTLLHGVIPYIGVLAIFYYIFGLYGALPNGPFRPNLGIFEIYVAYLCKKFERTASFVRHRTVYLLQMLNSHCSENRGAEAEMC